MNKLIPLLFVFTLLLAGCAETLEPTAIPANPNARVAPLAQESPTAGLPQPSGCQSKISGKVTDADGAPVKDAQVDIAGGGLKAPSRTVTDANGLYGFAGLCSGTYSFSVVLPGTRQAKPLSVTASVDGSNSTRQDLQVK